MPFGAGSDAEMEASVAEMEASVGDTEAEVGLDIETLTAKIEANLALEKKITAANKRLEDIVRSASLI